MRIPAVIATTALVLAMPAARAETGFDARVLAAHNRERTSLGLRPLGWSESLADGARRWAEHLAALGRLEHSRPEERDRAGENLWLGTAGHYRPEDMVGDWIAEKRDFVAHGAFPNGAARPGKSWGAVGHYTQLVWRDTTRVGCGLASSGAWDVLPVRRGTSSSSAVLRGGPGGQIAPPNASFFRIRYIMGNNSATVYLRNALRRRGAACQEQR